MKAAPLLITWHDNNAPIYSAHFEPGGKGRLATAGGDNHVRVCNKAASQMGTANKGQLWKVDQEGEDQKVEYLSTLTKHSQSVNVVRWAPKGDSSLLVSMKPTNQL
jgi:chromatin assembly factor 1 subunit B